MSNGCVVAALGTRSHGNRCGGWTLALVDHIAMVYILSVCLWPCNGYLCGVALIVNPVLPFSTGELTNPDCLKNPCV